MTYTPPPHGFRTFTIVWLTQSLSVIGGAMMGFALNVYLVQGLYPAPEQRAELALALTALNLAFSYRSFSVRRWPAPSPTAKNVILLLYQSRRELHR